MTIFEVENLTKEEQLTANKLASFKVPGMVNEYVQQLRNPNADIESFDVRFSRMVDAEWDRRYSNKLNKYMKRAGLRYPNASLDQTIYDPARKLDSALVEQLATCHWIDEGKNLLITGMSSSGKTYLSNAICVCALRQFKSVVYIRANVLIQQLERARLNNNYMEFVAGITSLDLLVIDDFGLMDLDLDKCRDLFEVIDGRDGRKSTSIVSQFPVKNWYDMFKDATYAEACLSRLTDRHHCYRLEMNGVNMRTR